MNDIKNYLDLLFYRNKIIECYYSIYSDYKILTPFSLDSKEDITLDFVNCTICGAKDNISNNKVGENYILSQPCLRNNHIDALKDKNNKTNYMGYFTMLGGFCYVNDKDNWIQKFNEIILKQFTFFRTIYKDNFIKLTLPMQYKGYLPLTEKTKEKLLNNKCQILYSDIDEENLKWKYGIEDVQGYGTRWEIAGLKKSFVNCGNDIVLFKNNKAIGIDFGSGLETLVSVLNGEEHLLYSNIVCSDLIKKFCKRNQNNEKLIDCLTSLLCIEHYKEYYNFRIKYLKYMYIKIISAICIINNISEEFLILLITDICKNISVKYNKKNILLINEIKKQKEYLYDISFSKNIEKLVNTYEGTKNIYSLRGYKKNIAYIEIEALKFIREREKIDEKAQKIKKRR